MAHVFHRGQRGQHHYDYMLFYAVVRGLYPTRVCGGTVGAALCVDDRGACGVVRGSAVDITRR